MSHLETIDLVGSDENSDENSGENGDESTSGGSRPGEHGVLPAAERVTPAEPPVRMGQILRTWLGFAALGAGMIHLALVISSPLPIAIALVLLGIAEFGWGVLAFARDELLAPRVARAVAVAPIILWSLLVVTATLLGTPDIAGSLTLLPMAIATLFGVFVAAVLSRHIRRIDAAAARNADAAAVAPGLHRADAAAPAAPSAGRYLVALMVGGLIVAFLTTPALAGTEAGRYAQPHGDHDSDFTPAPVNDDPLGGLVLPDHEVH